MLDFILIAIAVGIVSRLAKSKGYSPLAFGAATAVIALVCGFLGAYFFGSIGDPVVLILGVFWWKNTLEIFLKRKARKTSILPSMWFETDMG